MRKRNSWAFRGGAFEFDIPRLNDPEKRLVGMIRTRFGFLFVESFRGVIRRGPKEGKEWGYSQYEFIWDGRVHSLWEDRFRNGRGLAQVGHRFVREVIGECAT